MRIWDKKSREPHGVEECYLGTAMKHYIFHTVYDNKTKSKRIADTVEFPPKHNKMPGTSSKESGTNTSIDLIYTI